jgi:hypothetical protein
MGNKLVYGEEVSIGWLFVHSAKTPDETGIK